ncbi:hypothetical protein ATZ36_06070 [Candidatus Endomicrobiellum trichonymphae]|uniref:Lipoprotein n=1 Tax=Endomicrobium trichonymphae TaxID=1408204 RepID=A0A1E5II00_ENDTX|nr:hypothetical protein ATZ36_06070 [Candidatus Endomicrobium trichonymphae]
MSKILGTVLLIAILLTSCNKTQEVLIPKKDLQQEQVSQQVMQPMSKSYTAWRNAGGAYSKNFAIFAAMMIASKVCSVQYPQKEFLLPVIAVSVCTAQAYFFVSGLYYTAKGTYYSFTEKVQG